VCGPGRAGRISWSGAAKIVVTVAVLATLLYRVDPRSIVRAWLDIRVDRAMAALLLVPLNIFCQYSRLRVGIARVHPAAGPRNTFRALLVGLALGSVTPGRLGELAGVMVLPTGGRRRVVGVLGVLRGYGFFATMSLGLLMWAWSPGLLGLPAAWSRAAASLCFFGVIAVVVAGEVFFTRLRLPVIERLASRFRGIEDVFVGMRALWRSDRLWFGLWSLGLSVVFLTQLVFLVRAFGGKVGWAEGVAAGAITTGIVALLPIAAGGIGIRESAAIIVWGHLGVPAPVAFNGAFVLFVINAVAPGLVGLVWHALAQNTAETGPVP